MALFTQKGAFVREHQERGNCISLDFSMSKSQCDEEYQQRALMHEYHVPCGDEGVTCIEKPTCLGHGVWRDRYNLTRLGRQGMHRKKDIKEASPDHTQVASSLHPGKYRHLWDINRGST
jgi:hypothetical protein